MRITLELVPSEDEDCFIPTLFDIQSYHIDELVFRNGTLRVTFSSRAAVLQIGWTMTRLLPP